MRIARSLSFAIMLMVAFDSGAPPALITVNDFGDAGPGNCNATCTLRDAIGVALASVPVKGVTFSAAAGWPQTIALTQGQLVVNNASTDPFFILGPGASNLSTSAGNLSRVLAVTAGTVSIDGLSLRDGHVAGASPGPGAPGSGGAGAAGGAANGGCVSVQAGALLTIDHADVRNCNATGGTGGNGGSGDPSGMTGGPGGAGGGGGAAVGGGIYVAGNLTLLHSTVLNAFATSGPGGRGGDGGAGSFFNGLGGNGGPAGVAAGGAVGVIAGGNALIRNTTFTSTIVTGGDGGDGGDGGIVSAPGNGGNGGDADGGLVYVAGSVSVADLEYVTLANGTVMAGSGGLPGTGSTVGTGGQPGIVRGADIDAGSSVLASSSVVVGAATASLCFGSISIDANSVNLDQDSSCSGFTLHGSLEQLFLPLNLAASQPAYMPAYGKAVVDGATSCTQIGGVVVVADDEHRTPRPQGTKCDLGAIEADYVFVDGFN